MIANFHTKPDCGPRARIALALMLVGAAVAACAGGAAAEPAAPPGLMLPSDFGWTPLNSRGTIARYGTTWDDPPAPLRGPIHQDPKYPLRGNETRMPTPALGNWQDPILKPWAAAQMRQSNEDLLSGRTGIPFRAQSQCWPGGVPGNHLWSSEPMFFIQKPKEVWLYWQRDQIVRRIMLTEKHSEHVNPSWYGESIGHYENGELAVDTIGLKAHKYSFIDDFRTPHTDKLHVVEHFKVTPDGKFLELLVKVEDPDTFNEPMYLGKRWRRDKYVWAESFCAENNIDPFNSNLVPPPEAKTAEF